MWPVESRKYVIKKHLRSAKKRDNQKYQVFVFIIKGSDTIHTWIAFFLTQKYKKPLIFTVWGQLILDFFFGAIAVETLIIHGHGLLAHTHI